nr:EOG090X0ATU [Leptodora kindtii]
MRKAKRIAEQNAAEPPVQYPPYGYPHAGPNLDEGPMMYNNMAVPAAVYNPNMYYQPSMPQQPAGNDQMNFNIPTQLFQNPAMANMALQYGQSLVGQGKDVIDRELSKYVSTSRLKYYFSVDTAYVMKKLLLILFPFTHQDWAVKYNPEEPVQPRYEINAPDLYIPLMAFVTYVLVGGFSLGLQERFSPEALGVQASTALIWSILQVAAICLVLFAANIKTNLSTFDIVAYSCYNYVAMIVTILVSYAMPAAYHLALVYVSLGLMFFLVRSLKVQVLPESSNDSYVSSGGSGSKKGTYFLLFIAVMQPFLIWLLTRHLARLQKPT